MLPESLSSSNADEDETPLEDKLRHILAMAPHLLFLSEGKKSSLASFLENLLEDSDSGDGRKDNHSRAAERITLRNLRSAFIAAGVHDFSWSETRGCQCLQVSSLSPGDFGYISGVKEEVKGRRSCGCRFARFIKLGNINDDSHCGESLQLSSDLDIVQSASISYFWSGKCGIGHGAWYSGTANNYVPRQIGM